MKANEKETSAREITLAKSLPNPEFSSLFQAAFFAKLQHTSDSSITRPQVAPRLSWLKWLLQPFATLSPSKPQPGLSVPTLPEDAPYRPWIQSQFDDIYALESCSDLVAFQEQLATNLASIGQFYELLSDQPETDKAFADKLVNTCMVLDSGKIWHRGSKLRSHIDVSLQVRILRAILEALSSLPLQPDRSLIALATLIVKQAPTYRPALIVSGECSLQAGDYERAINAARQALALESSCPTTQQLLFKASKLRNQVEPGVTTTDIALYDLQDRFCSMPFDTLVTAGEGASFLCTCGGWLPYPVGDILEAGSVEEIWNSDSAIELRRSILDGDFSYCSRTLCAAIVGNTLPRKSEVSDPHMRNYIDNQITVLSEVPRNVQLTYDSTCNLACPSCRTDIIVANQAEQDRYAAARDRLVLPLLKRVNGTVTVTGFGDPFASKHYRSVLAALNRQEFPHLGVNILTNALVFTPQMWEHLSGMQEMVSTFLVSVDAATAKTYEKVRFPGRWSVLIANLEFISSLRQAGKIPWFGINFVVQKQNFHEMIDFVKLGLELQVDLIMFQKLWNFGSWDQTTFLDNDVADPQHPQHQELVKILCHPLFSHQKVNASNLGLLFAASKKTSLAND
jgi:wyosine [tRNA(Phe)-imidazoG37] synthetase (radical SAM superfamily)